jgi:tripartite ATP-independent transporter DctP family solute receptor
MFFKKKSIFLLSLLLVLSIALVACGGNQSGSEGGTGDDGNTAGDSGGMQEYNWRFVTEELDGQLQYEYAEKFAELLNEKSNGKITVQPYEFGGLGSEVDQVEQLQNGAVEFAIVSPGFTGTMVKEGQVFALHFLLPENQDKVREILDSSEALNNTLAGLYEEHRIKVLDYWSEGFMQWTSNDVKLSEPSSFQGFKMRTQSSPLIVKSYEAYGAAPTPMSWGELYTGLDQGTVQGQENPIFFIEDAKFNEVQDYMTLSRHNTYVAMTTVNPDFYNGLPEDVQQLIDDTVEELKPWIFDLQKQMNSDFLTKIKENEEYPTEIIELTEEQRAAFREKALTVREYYINEVSTVDGKVLNKLQEEIKAAE